MSYFAPVLFNFPRCVHGTMHNNIKNNAEKRRNENISGLSLDAVAFLVNFAPKKVVRSAHIGLKLV